MSVGVDLRQVVVGSLAHLVQLLRLGFRLLHQDLNLLLGDRVVLLLGICSRMTVGMAILLVQDLHRLSHVILSGSLLPLLILVIICLSKRLQINTSVVNTIAAAYFGLNRRLLCLIWLNNWFRLLLRPVDILLAQF